MKNVLSNVIELDIPEELQKSIMVMVELRFTPINSDDESIVIRLDKLEQTDGVVAIIIPADTDLQKLENYTVEVKIVIIMLFSNLSI